MPVIWKLVTADEVVAITRPDVVCVFSVVVAGVTVGALTAVGLGTETTAVAAEPRQIGRTIARRFLHAEAAGCQRASRGRELQAGFTLGQRNEAATGDRRRAIILIERAARDIRDLEVGGRS